MQAFAWTPWSRIAGSAASSAHPSLCASAPVSKRFMLHWVAKKDLVELERRTYLNLRTYNSFEMLKYHERNTLGLKYRKSESCCILGKSRNLLVKVPSNFHLAKIQQNSTEFRQTSDTICKVKVWQKSAKHSANSNENIILENGAKECIV